MSKTPVSRRHLLPGGEFPLPVGLRSTRATRALVAVLRSQTTQRLSAAEAEAALARMGVAVNRVTVFRALDRLAHAGLLQRGVDNDRVTRYQWRAESQANPQAAAPLPARGGDSLCAHFRCLQCRQQVAVDAAAPGVRRALQTLAHTLHDLGELQLAELQGLCSTCLVDAAPVTGG